MTRLACLVLLWCAGCAADPGPKFGEGDAVADAADEPDMAPADEVGRADAEDVGPLPPVTLELGHDDGTFRVWAVGDELVVIAGPQGGFHTEHVARATGASKPELHLALIWAEIWRDDLVLARAGWEFYDEQWTEQAVGVTTYLPPLVFDAQPEPGAAELRGSLELDDGRTAAFVVPVTLSDVAL